MPIYTKLICDKHTPGNPCLDSEGNPSGAELNFETLEETWADMIGAAVSAKWEAVGGPGQESMKFYCPKHAFERRSKEALDERPPQFKRPSHARLNEIREALLATIAELEPDGQLDSADHAMSELFGELDALTNGRVYPFTFSGLYKLKRGQHEMIEQMFENVTYDEKGHTQQKFGSSWSPGREGRPESLIIYRLNPAETGDPEKARDE